MNIDKYAYWVSFAIPLVLIVVSCSSRKLIESKPWHRKHFYLGLDLTIYFLAACLVNIADLAKSPVATPQKYITTLCLTIIATVLLWVLAAIHQEWEKDEKTATGQIYVLCVASNVVGVVMLYGFVRFKLGGLL
jgi:hypothetical protein